MSLKIRNLLEEEVSVKQRKQWIAVILSTLLVGTIFTGCGSNKVEQKKVAASNDGIEATTHITENSNQMTFRERVVQLPPEYMFHQEPDTTYKPEKIISADWKSSNKNYVTVDRDTGDITALKAGAGKSVTISVTHILEDGSEVEGSYTVQVQQLAERVTIKASSTSLAIGATMQLQAQISPKSADSSTVQWTSSNPDYAIVTAKGVVKAKKAGQGKEVTITATATDGSKKKGSLKLKIIDPNQPMIALTFDDGPSYESTKIVLDTLKKYNAKATFFVLGEHITKNQTKNREILKQSYEYGNEIASHTYDHKDLTKLTMSEVQSEVTKTSELLKEVTGEEPKLLRPPFGAINDTVANNLPYPLILWSVDTLDWQTRNTDLDVKAVLDNARDGAVILMHDIHMPTAKAVEIVVPELVKRGYQLVTVSELAQAKGITLENGKRYGSMHK